MNKNLFDIPGLESSEIMDGPTGDMSIIFLYHLKIFLPH